MKNLIIVLVFAFTYVRATSQIKGVVVTVSKDTVTIMLSDSTATVSFVLIKNAPVPVPDQVITLIGTNNTYRKTRRKINCKLL